MKRYWRIPIFTESEEEEDEKSESGEEPSLEEDRRDIKLPKDLLSKLKPKSFVSI